MINSNRCVYMNYALYASACYLSTGNPVITEFIQIQPEVDGIVYTVAIGYDSTILIFMVLGLKKY